MQTKIKEFFDSRWSKYQKIIFHNFMHHKELYEQTLELISNYLKRNFEDVKSIKFLDLGCGDAHIPAKIFRELKLEHYIGIDLSDVAITEAKQNFNHALNKPSLQFISGDISLELDSFIQSGAKFDVIYSSFCIHHFVGKDKMKLFEKIKKVLSPNGIFIYIDVFLDNLQDRKNYMLVTMSKFYNDLKTIFSPEELNQTIDHVENYDYPETRDNIALFLKNSGYNNINLVYSIKHYSLFSGC